MTNIDNRPEINTGLEKINSGLPDKSPHGRTRWALCIFLPFVAVASVALPLASGCGPAPIPRSNYETAVAATAKANTGGPEENPNTTATPLIIKPTETSVPATATTVATNTPEAKKDIPCDILPVEYCSQGEVIYTKNSQGGNEIYIGFKLPANVPIFAGMDGQTPKVNFTQPSEFQGSRVTVMDPDLTKATGLGFVAIGDLGFDNMFSLNVKKGANIAHTQNTGVTNLGGYNLIITIRERTPSGPIPAEEILRKYFPEAFAKLVKTLAYQGPTNPVPAVSRVFPN